MTGDIDFPKKPGETVTATLSPGDIEIGAVEIKNKDTDLRATVETVNGEPSLDVNVKTSLNAYGGAPPNDYFKMRITGDDTLPATIQSGFQDVAAAGTPEQLNGGVTLAVTRGVVVQAKITNTNKVYIGGSNVDNTIGIELIAGDSIFVEVDDVAELYIDVDTNAEGVKWTAY